MSENSKRDLPGWLLNLNSNKGTEVTLPSLQFTGTIIYCNNLGDCATNCEKILEEYSSSKEIILGFDMEWPVTYQSGDNLGCRTSLIQICDSEERCFLFNVSSFPKLPLIMLHLLEHPKTKLVGLNIASDLWKLCRDFDVPVMKIIKNNIVELKNFANKVLQCNQSWSLASLVAHMLRQNLEKDPLIRKSNWKAAELSSTQKKYAATDAFACYLLYQHLIHHKNLIQEL